MSGFADLVARAQPALAAVHESVTEGRDWALPYRDVVDDSGTAVDFTGAVGTCTVVDPTGQTTIITLTVTFPAAGQILCSASAAATAGLANGQTRRDCRWSLHVVKGGQDVQFWGWTRSTFEIEAS